MTQSPGFAIAFYAFAGLTVLGAVWVALLRNIVRSAFALLATFVGVAGLYALLSADLIAVVQVMVYVGGILVLMLFAVMLTARIDTVNVSNQSLGGGPAAAILVPCVVLIAAAIVRAPLGRPILREGAPTTARIGEALLGPYVLPFEAVSLLLLAALLGAVALSRGWGSLTRTPVIVQGAPAPTASPRRALRVLKVEVAPAAPAGATSVDTSGAATPTDPVSGVAAAAATRPDDGDHS